MRLEKPKKKNYTPILVVLAFILLLLGTVAMQAVGKREIVSVIKLASEVYQPGSTEVFEVGAQEVDLGGVFYDEITNYDAAVSMIFTQDGLKELEESTILGTPTIRKEGDKVYRASCMTDSFSTDFFEDISSVKIINNEGERSTYRVISVPHMRDAALEQVTIDVTVIKQNGRILIDDFNYPLSENN